LASEQFVDDTDEWKWPIGFFLPEQFITENFSGTSEFSETVTTGASAPGNNGFS